MNCVGLTWSERRLVVRLSCESDGIFRSLWRLLLVMYHGTEAINREDRLTGMPELFSYWRVWQSVLARTHVRAAGKKTIIAHAH